MAKPWILIVCLVILRDEFNALATGRDKKSDGSIGDRAHQESSSDHNADEEGKVPIRDSDNINEVHAIDVDKDLNEQGVTMEMVVAFILARCRSGQEKRLRYIIFKGVIWSASSGWKAKTYTGSNPHNEHAHFSASYESKHESDTSPWGLEELKEKAMNAAEYLKILRDPTVSSTMRAQAWQYAGNGMPGVPAGKSTLWVIGMLYSGQEESRAKIDKIAAAIDAIVKSDLLKEINDLSSEFAEQRAEFNLQLDAIEASVDLVDERVLEKIGGVDDPEEVARVLRAALGDKADAVFRAGLSAS